MKVRLGWLSASKKSALRRWLSRSSLLVVIEAVCRFASKRRSSAFSSTVSDPESSTNWPRTREMPAWRMVKPAEVWLASRGQVPGVRRSEEHTSELQSRGHLVCRLLLEKKKK